MHSTYSDGTSTIEDLAKSAVEKGLTTICITDHMPLPFETYYAVGLDRIQVYRDEIDSLRQQYRHKLTLLTGLEIEYMSGISDWIESIVGMGWDFLIVSVHGMRIKNSHYLINENEKEFEKTLDTVFKRDIRAFCRQYYHDVQQAVKDSRCDIAGHLDVIKKYNRSNKYFDETSLWYRELVEETLDVVKACRLKMEINTAGLIHPVGEAYPSPWIIESALKRGIDFVMGSDSHRPETLGQYFAVCAEKAFRG